MTAECTLQSACLLLLSHAWMWPEAGALASAAPQVNFAVSLESDLVNQERAIEYFESKYYNQDNRWSLNGRDLEEAVALGEAAQTQPALALAAAQVLYLYAWFTRAGDVIRENVVAAAQLFEQSIHAAGCSAALTQDIWLIRACDIRVGQALVLYQWLGESEDAQASAAEGDRKHAFLGKGQMLLDFLKTVPRYADASKRWASPWDVNFNQLRYPDIPSRPIWDASKIPLARFLEEHFLTFKMELEAIVNAPNMDLYELLRRADGSVESLATPGGWDAIRIVRYGQWFEAFCEAAPRTCELLRMRKELMDCPYVNTNYYKLFPNSHLKPHFGNAPRLTAHLPVIAPEPLRSGITVGPAQSLWVEGKAMVLDDTFAHSVSNWGQKPRYVLATWFCHPCDENNPTGQECSTSLS
mmetsp:Transcript_23405/g.54023  ORF Transcript_23405/g.54023 Transcript_23405/m.54023 type:complete len:412 (-) Transcript_23405:24-1259(-)